MIGISILAGLLFLGALLLFFPLRIRFYFVGAKKDSLIEIRFFRWKLFTTKEDPADETPESDVAGDAADKDTETSASTEDADDVENINRDEGDKTRENIDSDAVESSSYPHSETREAMSCRTTESAETTDSDVSDEALKTNATTESMEDAEGRENSNDDAADTKASKKIRELSEKEFLTLMFNPILHSMVLRMAWKLLRRTWRLFKIRFEHVVVQGIRMEYDEMGMLSAITSFCSSQVDLLNNWEFQMDWLKEKQPEIRGTLLIQLRLFFLLIWSALVLFYAARVYFWYRRNKKRFIENPLPFRLVFWRRKLVDLLAAEE